MHNKLYFAVIDPREACTSQEARHKVEAILTINNFCYDDNGAYFSGNKGDWFVIGGRWSGIFQLLQLNLLEFMDAPDGDEDVLEHQKKGWAKAGGKGEIPCLRATRRMDGYEDDAVLIDKSLYWKLLANFPQVELFNANEPEEREFKHWRPEELIGQWIVAIDYHY